MDPKAQPQPAQPDQASSSSSEQAHSAHRHSGPQHSHSGPQHSHSSFDDLARQLFETLTARGLPFERSSIPDGSLSFLYPRGWNAAWRDDHVSISHGVPPKGWLTLYPVPLSQKIGPEALMDAFIEEFVEPAAEELSIVRRARLERVPELEGLELRLKLAGKWCYGLALARSQHGQGRMISYWVEEGLFRRSPVEDLLLMLLGHEETPRDSRFAERKHEVPALDEDFVWPDPALAEALMPGTAGENASTRSFGSQRGRFALRLPPDWRGVELNQEELQGSLLLPPGASPDDPTAPLIVITGSDLLAPLESTLQEAIARLLPSDHFAVELPAREVPVKDGFALLQIWRGEGPANGLPIRLWSLGITDESSVVHLVAIVDARQLPGMLPVLAEIGRSVKVLPRQPNQALMAQLVGLWRFVEGGDKESEGLETLLELSADGSFALHARGINVLARDTTDAPTRRMQAQTLLKEHRAGQWDVVDETLNLYRDAGGRELFAVESLGERSAIIGGTFWERL